MSQETLFDVPKSRPWEWTPEQLDEAREQLKGRPLVVSISGGKDSTATALLMRHLGLPFQMVHMDTGWEDPQTERFVRDYLPGLLGGPITIVQSIPEWPEDWEPERAARAELIAKRVEGILGRKDPSAMVRWILRKGAFSSRARRWCTSQIKVAPLQAWAKEEMGLDFTLAVGVRAEESAARSKLPEWDMDDAGYPVWRPLLHWTTGDVIAWHHECNAMPNPLYTQGTARVGCYPCVMANKLDGRHVALRAPERIEAIRILEEEVTRLARERYRLKGEGFTHPALAPVSV